MTMTTQQTAPALERRPHLYVGMWATADGTFIDGVLHHGGMILHRTR
jgi:hypothetical protein